VRNSGFVAELRIKNLRKQLPLCSYDVVCSVHSRKEVCTIELATLHSSGTFLSFVRFQILMSARRKMAVVWVCEKCGLVEINRRFRCAWCFNHQSNDGRSKLVVFWVVAPCHLLEVHRRFRDAYCFHSSL
jgi:hypothetical protein